MFILMGEILLQSGLSDGLYRGISGWVARVPGGLLHSNIVACGIFAAVCGSSPATAATIGTVAIPELEKRNYNMKLVLGSLAAEERWEFLSSQSSYDFVWAFCEESIGTAFYRWCYTWGDIDVDIYGLYCNNSSLHLIGYPRKKDSHLEKNFQAH
jgi:hypothetical protein